MLPVGLELSAKLDNGLHNNIIISARILSRIGIELVKSCCIAIGTDVR